jgi:hypothetical protein
LVKAQVYKSDIHYVMFTLIYSITKIKCAITYKIRNKISISMVMIFMYGS